MLTHHDSTAKPTGEEGLSSERNTHERPGINLRSVRRHLLNGCELEEIESLKVNGKLTCRMNFTGENLTQLQLAYFQGKAQANLFEFRRAYSQLSSLVQKGKKKFRNQLKQQVQKKGGEA